MTRAMLDGPSTWRHLTNRWRRLGESGAVAIEMAFALPVFILFIYGIIELSHYVFTDIAVADAARDGARYAMVRGATSSTPASTSDITAYVKGRMGLIDPSQATVTVSYVPDNNPGSAVKVQVSYPFVPYLSGYGLGSVTVADFSQMTISQ